MLVVAALTRLVGLGSPHTLVFDETYYVKDAQTLRNLGYESTWPADADTDFVAGKTDIFQTSPSFVAHPPIGKWIIAAGLAIFGAQDSLGWRIGVALCGVLLVLVTMIIAQRLFRSTLLTVIAGGLLAIDGNAIVMSRVALLDTMLALFAALGVYFVLRDRTTVAEAIEDWIASRPSGTRLISSWGPVLWRRPWLLAAALAFGLASGVKWSGLYFLAVFALYALLSDLWMRRRARIGFWLSGGLLRQGPVTFLLTIPLALGVYVASWTGWFVSNGGYYRHWIENEGGERWSGALAWVPTVLQNWWHYQATMYAYHVGEHTPHAYQSNPLTWLFLVRPTSMYYVDNGDGTAASILGLANPLIWWAGSAALFYLVFRVIRGLIARQTVWREAFILLGVAAGYLPWMLYLGRTVFTFYTIAFEPYLILALTFVIGALLRSWRSRGVPGGGPGGPVRDSEPDTHGPDSEPDAHGPDTHAPDSTSGGRGPGLVIVCVFLGLCLLLSIYFWPLWTGQTIPLWYLRSHWWFPSWI